MLFKLLVSWKSLWKRLHKMKVHEQLIQQKEVYLSKSLKLH
jgi:hypothetical protein